MRHLYPDRPPQPKPPKPCIRCGAVGTVYHAYDIQGGVECPGCYDDHARWDLVSHVPPRSVSVFRAGEMPDDL